MKSLKWFSCAIVCVIALAWFFNKRVKPESAPLAQASTTPAAFLKRQHYWVPAVQLPDANTSTPSVPTKTVPEPERSVTPEEKGRTVIESKNVPVEFWGETVDQNDAPLAGVNIRSQIRHWDFVSGVRASQRNIEDAITTGADGQFHIGGSRVATT